MRQSRIFHTILICMMLTGCVLPPIPVPEDHVDLPTINVTIIDEQEPAGGLEVWFHSESFTACTDYQLTFFTNNNGKFSIESSISDWSVIGWEKQLHEFSFCFLTTDGAREYRVRTSSTVQAIDINCDLSIEGAKFCTRTCQGGWNNSC